MHLIRIYRILAIYWFQPRQGRSEDEQDTGMTPRSLKNDTVIPEARSMDARLKMFPNKRIHSQVGSGNVGRAIKHVLSPKDFSELLFWECALWISKKRVYSLPRLRIYFITDPLIWKTSNWYDILGDTFWEIQVRINLFFSFLFFGPYPYLLASFNSTSSFWCSIFLL